MLFWIKGKETNKQNCKPRARHHAQWKQDTVKPTELHNVITHPKTSTLKTHYQQRSESGRDRE